jgi:hypothetical protein
MKKTLLLVCALALCFTGSAQAYTVADSISGYPCTGGDGELQYNDTPGGHATNKVEMLVGQAWPGSYYNPGGQPWPGDYPHVAQYDPDADYSYPCCTNCPTPDIHRLPTHDPCHWPGTTWGTGLDINSQGYRLTSVHGNDPGPPNWNTITRLDASGQKYKGHNVFAHSTNTTGAVVWAEDNDPCAEIIFTGIFAGSSGIRRVDYGNSEVWSHYQADAGAPTTADGGSWLAYAGGADMEIGPDGLLYIMGNHHVVRMDHTLATPAARIASAVILIDETLGFGSSVRFWDMDIGPDGKIYVANDVAYWAGDPNVDEIRIYNSDGTLDQVLDETTTTPWPWQGNSLTIDMITVGPDKTIYAHVSGATGQVWRIPIPEPTTMLLLGLGSVALLRRKRS